jgi:hypothetical protein
MRQIVLAITICLFTGFIQAQNYSIKNRWNTKLSVSFNRTNETNDPLFQFDNIPTHPYKARLNVRAECNYGILNWLELGGYIGYMRYFNIYYNRRKYDPSKQKKALAPTFGVNINIHLLPFWVKNRNCRWELYLTAKYGGAYLINHRPYFTSSVVMYSDDTTIHVVNTTWSGKRYRHEFGVGIGGGVYFKNIFGLYAEALVGQYSYFPEAFSCYYTARVGVELKFTSKRRNRRVDNI